MRLDREHMTREALEQLIASGEGLRTEFKETTGQRGSRLVPVSRYVVAEASRSGCSPCRGGESVESARLGEALQSMNLRISEVEGGLLRRLDDVASSKAFYTFYTSTRPNKHAHFCQPFLARSTEISEIAESLRDWTTMAECLRVSIRLHKRKIGKSSGASSAW